MPGKVVVSATARLERATAGPPKAAIPARAVPKRRKSRRLTAASTGALALPFIVPPQWRRLPRLKKTLRHTSVPYQTILSYSAEHHNRGLRELPFQSSKSSERYNHW